MLETWVWSLVWEDSPGEGNGYPLLYSGLENPMEYIAMGSQLVGHNWVTFTSLHFRVLKSVATILILQLMGKSHGCFTSSPTVAKLIICILLFFRLTGLINLIKSVNRKEINPEYSLEELVLMLKLQYFGHLMQRIGSLEKTLMLGKIEDGRRRGWQKMRWFDGTTDSIDMSLGKLQKIVKVGEAWCCSS